MSLKIIPKGAIGAWISRLQSRGYRVVGPVEKHGQYVFDDIQDAQALVLDYPTTVLPPKKFMLPSREELFRFNTQTMEMEETIEAEPTAIFGMHTCDLHSMRLLDTVHGIGYADRHYQARRDQMTFVSIECLKPCMPGSFCKSMGTLTTPEHCDLHLTDLGKSYAIEVGSEKGAALLEGCTQVWDANDEDEDRLNDAMAEKWPNFQYRLEFDITELPELLGVSQNSAVWDALGEICLACGMCTQVCPTCYCFDVEDEVGITLEEGVRVRKWDSCQIEKFAVVAGGHNFRSSRALRQRHRFFRKGKYQYEAFGELGCVGCGRCALSCLVDITPIKTFNALHRLRASAEAGETMTVEEALS
ncbi:MAG: 4Fe-4S dicluster domain-containing protein [Anaerolineales bacterium]